MAKFVKGDVVVIPFPFSDLSQSSGLATLTAYFCVRHEKYGTKNNN